LTTGALGTGCGEPASVEPVASAAEAIIGGHDDAGDAAVVALVVRTQAGDEGLCSGLVVAPRVVLTAAHCVAPEAVGRDASFTVLLGSEIESALEIAVNSVQFDPEFSLELIARGHDVAVVITEMSMPVPALSLELPPELTVGSSLRLVGYGVATPGDADSAGRKRDGVVPLESFDSQFLYLAPGASPCDGDSGGPALVAGDDGVERVAGITSFARGTCSSAAVVTNLSSYLPFVHSQIAAADAAKTSPPSGSPGEAGSSCHVASPHRPGTTAWAFVVLGASLLARGLRRFRSR
jgi:secreted trypsin-like serine protease